MKPNVETSKPEARTQSIFLSRFGIKTYVPVNSTLEFIFTNQWQVQITNYRENRSSLNFQSINI